MDLRILRSRRGAPSGREFWRLQERKEYSLVHMGKGLAVVREQGADHEPVF